MLTTRCVVSIFSVAMMVLGAGMLSAQNYPNKPIRIVTASIGGGNDLMTRIVAQGISGPLGQPVIVDNRPTVLLGAIVAKATPDGYTMLLVAGNLWIAPLLEKTEYDPLQDFSPIALVSTESSVLVVIPSLGVNSVKELIALAKAKPGTLNYASGGPGTSNHLASELLNSMAGINTVRIDYNGGGPSVTGLLAGEVQIRIGGGGVVMPHVKSGKLKALAVTSAQPSELYPGLPAVAASLPGYEAVGYTAILAPAKTPEAAIKRLNQEIVRFTKTAEAKEKFFNLGQEIASSSPQELAAIIKSDMARWGKVIRDAGIKMN